MTTKIADVIIPEVFNQYVQVKTKELSALIQSGIAQNDPNFNTLASGPSTLINMPYWNDLTGDSEVMSDSASLTPGSITASNDVARKHLRARAWGANALASHLAGSNAMEAIANSVAAYWVREQQKLLVKTLAGVFAAPSMADLVSDKSATAVTPANVGALAVDAIQLLGDAKDNIKAVMMHSIVEAFLVKNQLITYTELVNEQGVSTRVPYFLNNRVIVDDSMPYNTTSLIASLYFFGEGAIAYGEGSDPNILKTEIARDSLASAGEDYLINRQINILHPRGVKWTEASVVGKSPTFAEVATADNWTRVYDKKQMRLVELKIKLTA